MRRIVSSPKRISVSTAKKKMAKSVAMIITITVVSTVSIGAAQMPIRPLREATA